MRRLLARLFGRPGLLPICLLVSALAHALTPSAFADDDRNDDNDSEIGLFCLTVLHSNDAESQLVGAAGQANSGGGATFVAVKEREQKDAGLRGCSSIPGFQDGGDVDDDRRRGVITVSSGDNILAGPEILASLKTRLPFGKAIFDALLINRVNFDALAIGNHEFDFGPRFLEIFIKDVAQNIRFISANLDFTREAGLQAMVDQGRIAKSIIVKKAGKRVGLVGATSPELPRISSPGNVVTGDDVAGAVQAEVDKLTAKGIEIILLISHLQSMNEHLAVLANLSGVDIVVAGGGNELLANPGDLLVPGDEADDIFGPYPLLAPDLDSVQVPVVTTAGQYKYLGRLECVFDDRGKTRACDGRPVRVVKFPEADAVSPDRRTQKEVTDSVGAFISELDAIVIAESNVALDGRRTQIRTQETNLGNLVADAILAQVLDLASDAGLPEPQVALQNGGGIRNENIIPAGPLTRLNTKEILPFPSSVTLVPNISRKRFKELLEHAVSDIANADGRFAQIAGFRFTYDISQPVGGRVQGVTLDGGTPIVVGGLVIAGDDLNIATIDFLARGGDGYPIEEDQPFTIFEGETYQKALVDYISEDLAGIVDAGTDYAEGGVGRITQLP